MSNTNAQLETLGQLLDDAVANSTTEESPRWCGILEALLRLVWSLHGNMDYGAARCGLEALRPVVQRVRRMAAAGLFDAAALSTLEEAYRMLQVATVAAKSPALLQELQSHPECSKKTVLGILARERRFMCRDDIRECLCRLGSSVTGQHISQVLAELHHQGFLLRRFGDGRARKVAIYALSDEGRAVWDEFARGRTVPQAFETEKCHGNPAHDTDIAELEAAQQRSKRGVRRLVKRRNKKDRE